MDKITRTNQQVFDIPGTITGPDGFRVSVHFDLIEMEDLVDGIPCSRFSYGVLRFLQPLESSMKSRLLSATPLTITGGGIQATLCLYKLNTFTLAGTIREFPVASKSANTIDRAAA